MRSALVEVPVGFKWFVPGLLDGSLGFGGEESAGASFLRRDGSVWTTDKDGIIMDLLAGPTFSGDVMSNIGYAAIGLRMLPGFFLGILAGAIVLTWLYNSSRGSVLAAALWHASFNFVTASPNAAGLAVAVTSTLVIVWAVAIVWGSDWMTLAGRSPRLRAAETPSFVCSINRIRESENRRTSATLLSVEPSSTTTISKS